MEGKNKIIILALIVVIVALLAGIVATMQNMNKIDTNVTYKGTAILNESGSISIKLTDMNGTPLAGQTVNITVTDKDKSSDFHSAVTDDKGIGKLKLGKNPGKYNVTIVYGGNDKYNGCNATKKITIQEETVEAQLTSSSSDGESSSEPSSWTDSNGAYHFYENGQEYVGDPNAQHMTIEMSNYVREHGMGD